jgi:hypothetical protein
VNQSVVTVGSRLSGNNSYAALPFSVLCESELDCSTGIHSSLHWLTDRYTRISKANDTLPFSHCA